MEESYNKFLSPLSVRRKNAPLKDKKIYLGQKSSKSINAKKNDFPLIGVESIFNSNKEKTTNNADEPEDLSFSSDISDNDSDNIYFFILKVIFLDNNYKNIY